MKDKERYTVYDNKKKVILKTNEISEALKVREENKHIGAYIEDRKNKNKHRNDYIG
ncbi:MAG: hypothetical protein KAT74_02900 [Candidatus Cloacimonetes bacterium]|jgi:hypothetical protein|nr:hypothetical protein [Candidatus Cloacimonadota bacterium]